MNQPHSDKLPPVVTGIRKLVFWCLALVFFLLAMLGVILPGVPTTPFLLLMGYFLIRVSPELNARVLEWPVVGKPVREWQEKGGVRPRVKLVAYLMVTILVGISLVMSNTHWIVRCVIVAAAIVGVVIVWRLPTIRE